MIAEAKKPKLKKNGNKGGFMANSNKWYSRWGQFVAGDIVDCLVFREENGTSIERVLKMRVGSARAGEIPPGHAPVIYETKKYNKYKKNLAHPVPIDNLSWPS